MGKNVKNVACLLEIIGGLSVKKKIRFLPVVFIAAAMLTACGKDPQMIQFRDNVDAFCTKISEIDTSINGIDPESPDAVSRLLADLDDLNSVFRDFADLDFPGDFDYLEELADRSAEFMSDAVDGYRQAYADDSYNPLRTRQEKIIQKLTNVYRL